MWKISTETFECLLLFRTLFDFKFSGFHLHIDDDTPQEKSEDFLIFLDIKNNRKKCSLHLYFSEIVTHVTSSTA